MGDPQHAHNAARHRRSHGGCASQLESHQTNDDQRHQAGTNRSRLQAIQQSDVTGIDFATFLGQHAGHESLHESRHELDRQWKHDGSKVDRNLVTQSLKRAKTNLIFSYNNQRNQQFDPYGNPKDPTGMNGDFTSNGINGNNNGINNPLAHLNDSVNSLDPLNAMEKSLNDQVILKLHAFEGSFNKLYTFQMPHTPHTPHTPNGGHNPMTPGGPPSVPPVNDMQNGTSNSNNSHSPQHQQNILNSASNIMNSPQSLMNSPQNMMNSPQNMNQNMQQNLMNSIPNLTDVDLNFDPAAVIDGEGGNDLNVSSAAFDAFKLTNLISYLLATSRQRQRRSPWAAVLLRSAWSQHASIKRLQ